MIIRTETPTDYQAIRRVTEHAFSASGEADLIEQLRNNPQFNPELSLVAVDDDVVVGHILFFPVSIHGRGHTYPSLALAPMSVLEKLQGKGIGSKLIESGFEKAKALGYSSIIVLGHPSYYPRFGFVPAADFGIKAPVEEWAPAFFAKELEKDALKDVSGMVLYPPEFGL